MTSKIPAILSYGFRPFFLLGAVQAGLAIALWIPFYLGDLRLPTALSPVDWHVHEMLYGYVPGIIAGFLLTAIPNWTGRPPLHGRVLALLVGTWLAGRLAVTFSDMIGQGPAAAVDILFLLALAGAAAREIAAGRNWRNLPPIAILLVFLAGNVVFHAEAWGGGSAVLGTRIGIAAAIALIALIGGRVIPSFTRNWLVRENPGRLPAPFDRYDAAALAISTIALILWIAIPESLATAVLMLVACILHAGRLMRWAGDRTLRDRLVLILHVAYAFIPLGFLLLAGAVLFPDAIPPSAGIHAWTAGAIGIMTLAMMTRVSLGHTGRKLSADPVTHAIYVAIVAAAVLRIWAALDPALSMILLQVAAGAWMAAFGLFAVGYALPLVRPRVKPA